MSTSGSRKIGTSIVECVRDEKEDLEETDEEIEGVKECKLVGSPVSSLKPCLREEPLGSI